MRTKAVDVSAPALGLVVALVCACQTVRQPVAQDSGRAAVVVLLVVDQLPEYLFAEYESAFTGGFRRLLDGGFRYTQASYSYANTHTAAGHATLATGVVPAVHGVVANAWLERRDTSWEAVEAVADPSYPIVGAPSPSGVSPATNAREGLPDWLMARDPVARVLSVSSKDRSAVGLAARATGHVYWIDTEEGRFVSSRYYRSRLPEWIDAFNEVRMPGFLAERSWESSVPDSLAHLSRRDTVGYEGDGIHTHFPHRFVDEGGSDQPAALHSWISGTPIFDQAVIDVALAGVEALGMGADGATDYLALSLSQTDLIGHAYGPHSREQLDNLLRLDRALGGFLEELDQRIGPGRWILAMTSDHGVLPIPEYLEEQGLSSRRTSTAELQEMIIAARRAERDGDRDGVAERAAAALRPLPLAEQVFTGAELMGGAQADSFAILFARSYHPDRGVGYFGTMDVLVRFPERILATTYTTGTDHRTAYWYDRHVPLILYGAGIEPGASDAPVDPVDVAPTLAAMVGLGVPSDLNGRVIYPPSRATR